MKPEIKKIVIIGPESTGKSSLCELLARHYKTAWVPEYAREYLITNGTDYTFENLFEIAEGQLEGEAKIIADYRKECVSGSSLIGPETASPVFIDTDLYVIKVWSEVVFNKCDNRILSQIANRPYDLYLLCNTDLPWVKDSLREYPDLKTRERLYHHYKDAMIHQNTECVDISGNYEERLNKAIVAVDRLLKQERILEETACF